MMSLRSLAPRRLFACAVAAAAILFAADATYAPPAEARVMRPAMGHYIRHVRLQGTTPGVYRTGLWVMDRSSGRVRLCLINGGPGSKVPLKDILTCSPWAGGSDKPGQYQMMDIRAQVDTSTGGRMWAVTGVWILNYRSGEVRACLFQDLDRPVATLQCSPIQ